MLYPEAGVSLRSREIGPRHSRFVYEYNKSGWEGLVDQLFDEVKSSEAHTVIISSEAWSRPNAFGSLHDLIKRFQLLGICEVFILVSFRNILDYSVSNYREFVRRWGWSLTYEEYVRKRLGFFDYAGLSEKFLSLPSAECKFFLYNENIVDDMIDYMGVGSAIDEKTPRGFSPNKSLSALDVEVVRIFNKYKLGKVFPQSEIPSAESVLSRFGLSSAGFGFVDFDDVTDLSRISNDRNVERFTNATGIQGDVAKKIFNVRKGGDEIPVSRIRQVLERACFDYCALSDSK